MKAAIIGYGKSGKAAENILRTKGYSRITIFDDGDNDFASVSDFRDVFDLTVISPGIDRRKMEHLPEEFTSEIELANSVRSEGSKVVAITGTNGKSTVTTLTEQILNNAGVSSVACGNIGLTYGDAVDKEYDCYVVELSSFQTGMLKEFDAECVIVTNIAEDHMDRYTDIDDYTDDKLNLLDFLKDGGRLIIEDEKYLSSRVEHFDSEKIKIDPELLGVPNLDGSVLSFGKFFVDVSEFALKGKHNLVNLSFALLAADKVCGLEGDVTKLIDGLSGLEHRCEYVITIDGVDYINDSKGTNVHSTYNCLKGFDKGVVIILGGKDKNGDFSALSEMLNKKASAVVAYGHAGEKIFNTLKDNVNVPVVLAGKLADALEKAKAHAKYGEKVILSPACASFDEFRSFEHRGEYFKGLLTGGGK